MDSILDSVGSIVGVGKSAAVEKENSKLKAENERMKKAFAEAVLHPKMTKWQPNSKSLMTA